MSTSLLAICCSSTEKCAISWLFYFLLHLHAWSVAKLWMLWGSPVTILRTHMHTPIRVQHGKHTLSDWLAQNQSRQTLIGIEQDCSVRRCSCFCKCQSVDLVESLVRDGFLVPTIVLLSRPSGKQVGAQLRYQHEKIIGRWGEWKLPPLSWRLRKVALAGQRWRNWGHEKKQKDIKLYLYLSERASGKTPQWVEKASRDECLICPGMDKWADKGFRVVEWQLTCSLHPSSLATCHTNTQALIKNAWLSQAF